MFDIWMRRLRLAQVSALGLALLAAPPLLANGADGPSSPAVVNVNTATIAELQFLPGIGESRARAIIAAREQLGGFKNVDELVEVRGIGPAGLERLRPHVILKGKTRIPRPKRAE